MVKYYLVLPHLAFLKCKVPKFSQRWLCSNCREVISGTYYTRDNGEVWMENSSCRLDFVFMEDVLCALPRGAQEKDTEALLRMQSSDHRHLLHSWQRRGMNEDNVLLLFLSEALYAIVVNFFRFSVVHIAPVTQNHFYSLNATHDHEISYYVMQYHAIWLSFY